MRKGIAQNESKLYTAPKTRVCDADDHKYIDRQSISIMSVSLLVARSSVKTRNLLHPIVVYGRSVGKQPVRERKRSDVVPLSSMLQLPDQKCIALFHSFRPHMTESEKSESGFIADYRPNHPKII